MERGDNVRLFSTARSASNGTSPLPPAGEAPDKHIGGGANAITTRAMGERRALRAMEQDRTGSPG